MNESEQYQNRRISAFHVNWNRGMNLPQTERRKNSRLEKTIPVQIWVDGEESLEATTRDISASGVYFFLLSNTIPRSALEFVLSFPPEITLYQTVTVRCRGKIVRVDRNVREGVGIAVNIHKYEFLRVAAVEYQ